MGKDADGCCEACKQFGDQTQLVPEPAAPPLRAKHELVKIVVTGGRETFEVLPTRERITVGRVSDNDVVLKSGTISKRQCLIEFRDEGVIIADSKSSCGTYINGRHISQPTMLKEGAVVYVGDFQLRVVPR
ncbi:MAG TPA: FHA domain-containing protein [Kofleriaceae bacterium]